MLLFGPLVFSELVIWVGGLILIYLQLQATTHDLQDSVMQCQTRIPEIHQHWLEAGTLGLGRPTLQERGEEYGTHNMKALVSQAINLCSVL